MAIVQRQAWSFWLGNDARHPIGELKRLIDERSRQRGRHAHDWVAGCGAQLRAMHARSNEAQRLEQNIDLHQLPTRQDRQRPIETFGDAGKQRRKLAGDDDLVRRRRDIEQRAVDVEEEGVT